MPTNKIVVVEDDEDLGIFIRDLLTDQGYSVRLLNDGAVAIDQIKKTPPDLLILDLGLPTVGGETVCMEVKKAHPNLPVIILTGRSETSDIVKGLSVGADDYIAKPFESEELTARIQATLRAYNLNNGKLKVGDLELDSQTVKVTRAGTEIPLTAQEFKLLEYLMNNEGRVLSRDLILSRIWDTWSDIDTRAVDVYIGYLRKKIDTNYKTKLLHTIRGFGYTIKQ